MERIHALILLAWGLVRSLLATGLGRRRGLTEFHASYAHDRLPAVKPEERAHLAALAGCIACGLCDYGEARRVAASRGEYAGAMDLMLASARSMPDFDAAARSFGHVPDDRLAALEARCPARVPMRAVAAWVRAKALDGAEAMGGADDGDGLS